MKTIAVLLTCYNRKAHTLACLDALYMNVLQKDYNMEVFLVDDGSTDGTTLAVTEFFPKVHVIKGTGSLYWNQGMRLAWKTALAYLKFDFFIWLNDDTFLFKDAFDTMFLAYENNKPEVIVVGATCSAKDNLYTTYGGRNGKNVIQIGEEKKKCTSFNGNFVLIPYLVYEKLGILDGYFRHSFGDVEYGMRANRNNVNCIVVSKHIGYCERHESIAICFNPQKKIHKRFKHFYSPLGMNPFESFYINIKYYKLFKAFQVFLTTHLRVLFPMLWRIN